MKKLLFIFNRKSGRAMIQESLSQIIDIFTKAGYLVTAYPTQGIKDATVFLTTHEIDYDRIVCSGGDGTLNDVVCGILNNNISIPLGYIPSGSTNDFAQTLGIPMNMVEAASIAIDNKHIALDVGTFNQQTFIYIAAFGLFTEVSYETKQEVKNVLGHMAYIIEGIKSLSSVQYYNLKVEANDQIYEGEYIYGMITNSVSVGGVKHITGADVELDDGEFEVTLIKRPQSLMEMNMIVPSILTKNYDECDAVEHFKTSSLHITSQEPIKWTLDGEFGGEHTQVTITNKKQAFTMTYNEIQQ